MGPQTDLDGVLFNQTMMIMSLCAFKAPEGVLARAVLEISARSGNVDKNIQIIGMVVVTLKM